VQLVRDVEARDRYDRLLAYVYRASDGRFVNLAMVEDGFADQYTFPPNVAHTDDFRTAAREAREAGSGLWSACEAPFEE
jgi:micrococcal nuclease